VYEGRESRRADRGKAWRDVQRDGMCWESEEVGRWGRHREVVPWSWSVDPGASGQHAFDKGSMVMGESGSQECDMHAGIGW
jgi:hypothetical protein